MASEKITKLEELTKLAADFVTRQKGLWDHAAWTDFLTSVRTKGFDISEEMQSGLGDMLEAMKRFYSAAASTQSVEKAMRTVVNDSVAFVKQHKGVWGHSEWEDFLKTARQNTLSLSEGTAEYLGGVLESVKAFYRLSPVSVVQKRVSTVREKAAATPQPALTAEKKPEAEPVAEKAPAQPKAAEKPLPAKAKKPEAEPVAEKAPAQPKAAEKPLPAKAKKPDDLTAIGGVGPAMAKKLIAAGITTYAELAALSETESEELDKSLNFKGRIKRDDWVGQAKKLSQDR